MASSIKKMAFAGVLLAWALAATAQDISDKISVNSVGFLPNHQKRASVKVSGVSVSTGTFTVNRADNGAVAFSGELGNNVRNTDTGDTTRLADFSSFTAPGRYYVSVPGTGRSPEFDIGDNAFNEPFKTMMLGMYLWRCGTEVDATHKGRRYHHPACHLSDANVCHDSGSGANRKSICVGGTEGTRDAVGGWHDAGDYNKYTVNSGVTVGLMLKAWEHHSETLEKIDLHAPKDGNIPKYLSEVKWNLDWVAKMQYDDGKVSHKLTTINFCDMRMPDRETAARYFARYSTAATGAFVAMLAQASRIYEPYDKALADKWLNQARVSYTFLKGSPFVKETQPPFNTGGYGASSDNDQRLWAAAEMWETTGEAEYLRDYESRARVANVSAHIGWADVSGMAALTYLTSERPGRRQSFVDSMRTAAISAANTLAGNTSSHGYGRAFGTGSYYWGNHGALTANAYILNVAHKLTGEKRYRDAGHEILGHIFGRNYFSRSFVTGVGHNPPQFPHDRRSSADKAAWPGYIIGGPHCGNLTESNGNPIAPPGVSCPASTPGVGYFDVESDYARNEIAINWNGSMIYALSGFVVPENITGAARQSIAVKPSAAKVRTMRLVVRNGRASAVIPEGTKIYSLNGRLVAQRKIGDPNIPVIRRNGIFIMRKEH